MKQTAHFVTLLDVKAGDVPLIDNEFKGNPLSRMEGRCICGPRFDIISSHGHPRDKQVN
jgi:hypothetical protein